MKTGVNLNLKKIIAWIFLEKQMVIISVIKLYITKAVYNKNFRKSTKPYFSGKGSISSNITLV